MTRSARRQAHQFKLLLSQYIRLSTEDYVHQDQNDTTTYKNSFRNKAVSDSTSINRVFKFIYGSFIRFAYDPNIPVHQYQSQKFTSTTGTILRGSYKIILFVFFLQKLVCYLQNFYL